MEELDLLLSNTADDAGEEAADQGYWDLAAGVAMRIPDSEVRAEFRRRTGTQEADVDECVDEWAFF
jgi:hypothetical protein